MNQLEKIQELYREKSRIESEIKRLKLRLELPQEGGSWNTGAIVSIESTGVVIAQATNQAYGVILTRSQAELLAKSILQYRGEEP